MRYTANISDLFLNIINNKLYYSDIDNYKYDDEYIKIVKNILSDWNIFKSRVFFQCLPKGYNNIIKSGWKIHISSIPSNSKEILSIVSRLCGEHKTPFKFVMDKHLRDMSSGKNWSRSSSGKFVTIYPKSNIEFEYLIEELYKYLKYFEGPYILTDKRYKDCKVLYYRYGTITPDVLRYADGREYHLFDSPEGTIEIDERQPYYYKPEWIEQPSFEISEGNNNEELSLKEGRYLIVNVIKFSASGGVYIAEDKFNNKKVVIKEARPFTMTSIYHDGDAISNLEKEYNNLLLLQNLDCVPKPIDYFKDWEHTFLVQEYIDYESLGEFSATKSIMLNPNPSPKDINEFNTLIEKIFLNISKSIKAIHDLGYVINDLSPNNIMIDMKSLDIKLIDLESLTCIHNESKFAMNTPGYTPKHEIKNKNVFTDDLYGLGTIMFDIIFSGAIFKDINETFYEKLINRLSEKYYISKKVCFLILKLTSSVKEIDSIDDVIKILVDKKNNDFTFNYYCINYEENYSFRDKLLHHIENQIHNDKLITHLAPLRQNNYNLEHGLFGIYHILNYCGRFTNNKVSIDDNITLDIMNINNEVLLPGLYNGKSGIAWVLLEMGYTDEALKMIQAANYESKHIKNYSIYCGLAGIALTNLYFYLTLNNNKYLEFAIKISEDILNNFKEYQQGIYWENEDNGKSIGFLEGATGISLLFIYMYKITNNLKYLEFSKKAINHDLSYVKSHFNGVKSLTNSEGDNITKVSPYIESGSAGLVMVLLRLLKYDKNAEAVYKDIFEELMIDCQRIYTAYPTFFDGLSGLGNLMLDCYDFTLENKYKKCAYDIADTIRCYELKVNNNESCIPGIYLLRSSHDFATGTSGVLGFIERLINNKHDYGFTLDYLLK